VAHTGKRRARHTGPAPARMAPGAHQRTGQAARQHLRGLQHAPRACVLRALPHRHHLPARAGTLANRQGLRACGRRTLRPAARRAAREGRDCTTWQARSRNAACCRPMSSWSASAAIAPPPPPPAPTAAAAAGTCGTGPLRRWPLESFGAGAQPERASSGSARKQPRQAQGASCSGLSGPLGGRTRPGGGAGERSSASRAAGDATGAVSRPTTPS